MRLILRLFLLLLAWGALGGADALGQACTTATSTIDYTTAANGDRKTSTETVGTTTATTSGYATNATGSGTNTFAVGTNNVLYSKALVWQQNSQGAGNNTGVGKVTYTFNRPVTNLKIVVTDIDQGTTNGAFFTDRMTFDGYVNATDATPITLTTANVTAGNSNVFVGSGSTNLPLGVAGKSNAFTGTLTSNASAASNVTVTFPQPVTKLTLSYENLLVYTANTDRTQTSGIVSISFCRTAPKANDVTNAATLPTNAGQVNIDNLSSTVDGTVQSYTVTAIPPAAQGVLYYNSTGSTYAAVANNQVLTPAQAASLRFDPAAGATGTSTAFSYTATDDANLVSNTATYTIPLQVVAPCVATAALDFSNTTARPAGESWKGHAAISVPAGSSLTTIGTSGYTITGNPTANTLQTAVLNGTAQTLVWSNNYPASGAADKAAVTFNFSRPVANFTVQVQDIDGTTGTTGFQDQVTFTGSNGGVAVTPVLSPVNPNAAYTSISGNTATGVVATGGNTSATDASVIAYFGAPITSLTITYSNITTATGDPGVQLIGIDLMNFCRLEPVANDITVSSVPNAAGQLPITALSSTVDGTAQSYVLSTLPPASQGVLYVNGIAATTGQVLTPLNATQLTFDPAVTFSGSASFTYTVTDDANVSDQTPATYIIPVSATGASGVAAACANPGKDGAATLSTNPNTYFPSSGAQTLTGGTTTSIVVGAATGAATSITAGDLLLVIQMQGADINSTNTDSYGDGTAGGGANGNLTTNFTAGQYEYVVASNTVTVTAGGTIQLVGALKNSYVNALATATTGQRTFQVIRVPQYTSLTLSANLTATAWNGSSGGLIVLDVAGQTNLAGFTISANAAGFRGGAGRKLTGIGTATGFANTDYRTSLVSAVNGIKGEGTAGTPRYVNNGGVLLDTRTSTNGLPTSLTDGYPSGDNGRGAPGNAGGGATDGQSSNNGANSGGGGGANGGAGGRGGDAFSVTPGAFGGEPGAALAAASSSRLTLGGGGGAGTNNDGTGNAAADGFASSGAAGGGIVILRTGTISGTGTITANGASAANGTTTTTAVQQDGGGGAGAGGSILVTANTPSGLAGLTLSALGGTGGKTNPNNAGNAGPHGPGGGGGGGIILANGTVASTTVAAGTNGLSTANGNTTGVAFGAAAGTEGLTNAQISNSIANSTAGPNCIADVATVITAPTNPVLAGQSATLNVAFVNNGGLDAANVTRQVQLPTGLLNVAATNGGTYNSTTGLVTYPAVATVVSGGNASSVITFTAPATGPVSATSTIGTASPDPLTANNTSTLPLNVTPVADVTTTLAGPTVLNPGQPSGTYTATFTNNGPSTGSAVTQQVTLPTGATNVVVPSGATYISSTGVINFGTATTLASGATNTFNFSFTAPTAPGSVALTSNVGTSTSQGPDTAPNAATLSATINTSADVVATITAGASPVVAGQTGTFNVTFLNNGPATATGVSASVQLPAGLTGVTVTNNGSYDATTGLVSYPGIGGVVSGSGNRVDTKITFTAPATGPVTGTASISTTTNEAGQTANNTQSAVINVTPAYDVATTIAGPATTAVGVQSTFSITTSNNGPSVAPGVVQTVQLPTGLTNVYVSNGGTYNSTTGVVTFPTLATLANGARVDNTVSFTPVAATNFTATATVVANTNNTNDTNTANNAASAPATTVNAALAATTNANIYTSISTPSANVAPGATTTFTVTSGNRGAATATTVAQQTTLPIGLSGVVVKDAAGSVVANTATTGYNSATGVVVVPAVASVVSGATTSYTISLTAPASGVVAAVATISSNNADPMPSDNIATADVTVSPATDVAIALTGPTSALAGQSLTYTATTTNNGPATATNVVQTVIIPAGLIGVTVSGGGTYNSATGVVTFPTIVSQAVGNSVSNTITYVAPVNGPLVNVASVASATPETTLANNGSTVTTAILPSADVAVFLTGPSALVAGNTATYTATTTNNGPTPAVSETTTVQLPANLNSVVVRDASGNTIANAYNATTGVVTLAALANQLPGAAGTVSNTISFTVPAGVSELTASANAAISGTTNDANLANNNAVAVATVAPATATTTDVQTTVTSNVTTQNAGSPVVFTVSTINNGPNAAANVVQTLTLPAGLTGVTVSNSGTYNASTGVVTFPTVASQAGGNTTPYTVTVNAPGAGPLTAVASASSATSDSNSANNLASTSVTVTPLTDVAVTLAGPTAVVGGQSATYAVSVLNNGPSLATSTTTVQFPAGLTVVSVSNGGTYNSGTGVVTFPAITNQLSGASGLVTYTITAQAPAAIPAGASFNLVATLTPTAATNDQVAANNSATLTVSKGNLAPVANAVTNVLQGPEGNTAGPLAISSLSGTDPDGNTTIASYTVTSIPDATNQGVLALNGVAVTVGQSITPTQASQLSFDPVAAFVGNAFFAYTATDAAGAVSASAIYTIPVGQDLSSVYTLTPTKGAASPYQNGDVIANVFDANSGVYNNASPQAVTDTGIRTAALTSGPLPAGTALNPVTGIITVTNRALLKAGNYPVTITTVDANGGTNTNTFTIVIGALPLPVELLAFTATAVGNRDAALAWRTASEKNNDHFDVERSFDGMAFVKIGQVQGQGSTSSATDYAFTDAYVAVKASGAVYYRLAQVDADGTVSRSPVQVVKFTKAAVLAIGLYPNPAVASTHLDLTQLPAGTYAVSVLDATGRAVLRATLAGAQSHVLDLTPLASGSYVVQVRGTAADGTAVSLTKRLVKE